MFAPCKSLGIPLLLATMLSSCGSGGGAAPAQLSSKTVPSPLATYALAGSVQYVEDPSIFHQGSAWYVFSSDLNSPSGHLAIRCSTDKVNWNQCGFVFAQVPQWIEQRFISPVNLRSPEVSYFNGIYHLYYAASDAGTNHSVIALATNTTLDSTDPAYQWVDQGEVMESNPGDDFNAIDPSVLVDGDGSIWLTFGSYWTGIKQRLLDSTTGLLSSADSIEYALAERPGSSAVEAASLVQRNGFYYLFVSFGQCCQGVNSTYRIMYGRATSIHGPYRAQDNAPMLMGGATELLTGNGQWAGPGGQSVLIDPLGGDTIVFHAYAIPDGSPWLHVNSLLWPDDWPVIK